MFMTVIASTPPAECDQDASFICDTVLEWTDGNEDLARFADAFLGVFIILAITWLITKLVRRYVGKVIRQVVYPDRGTPKDGLATAGVDEQEVNAKEIRRSSRLTSISRVVEGTTTVIIWVIGGLLALGELGVNIGPLLAGAGLAAAGLSFGAQKFINDLISGLFVLIEDQYGIGDVIDLGEAVGTVETISLRATVVRGLDGTVWHVANGEVQRIGNFSKLWSVAMVDVDVAYDADIKSSGDIILDTAKELCASDEWVDEIVQEPKLLGVEALGADGITLRLLTRVKPGTHWALQRAMRLAIKDALDDAGVEIPFPQRTVWLRTDPA